MIPRPPGSTRNDTPFPSTRRFPAPCRAVSGDGKSGIRTRLCAKAELGLIAPHAMQGDGELAGDRHACARHAAAFCDAHAPGPQAGPFAAAPESRARSLLKRRAGELVAASADPALDVGLARPVTRSAHRAVWYEVASPCTIRGATQPP